MMFDLETDRGAFHVPAGPVQVRIWGPRALSTRCSHFSPHPRQATFPCMYSLYYVLFELRRHPAVRVYLESKQTVVYSVMPIEMIVQQIAGFVIWPRQRQQPRYGSIGSAPGPHLIIYAG